ncbi:MAG: 4Fe-4S binding protein, partial [Actinomycetota bacterium]|nr:4Fe-4S binding protein [Actinomycetota bacterium]
QYPDEKPDLPARTRGVIALKQENCTVCYLCSRECPDWCIYIDSHKETLPPKREGGRPRKRNVLDRFAIDYALCMYCGICVEVCPYDALFWSREFEYSEYDIRQLTHEKEKLSDWMASVLPPPPLEEGALLPGQEDGAAAKPAVPPAAAKPASTPQATVEATGARPPTTTASAVEQRPQQAESAPKAGSFATEAARPAESVPPPERDQAAQKPTTDESEAPVEKPAVMAKETVETGAPAAPDASDKRAEPQAPPAEAAEQPTAARPEPAKPGPNVEVPHEAPHPVALERTEDPEQVYQQVLAEQREKGSSPQVAEARAKVARVKAERGIKRGPTPMHVEHPVPSAPVSGEEIPPTPSGAPEAVEPQPEQGPVAPDETDQTGGSDG